MDSFVEKLCISNCKTMFKKIEKICGFLSKTFLSTILFYFSQTFLTLSTMFFTLINTLFLINFFHFSTKPTNITTK